MDAWWAEVIKGLREKGVPDFLGLIPDRVADQTISLDERDLEAQYHATAAELAECRVQMADKDDLIKLLRAQYTALLARHVDQSKRLEKAEHDRARYKKRIRFLQGRHDVLVREYHATVKERDVLNQAVTTLEHVLNEKNETEANANG